MSEYSRFTLLPATSFLVYSSQPILEKTPTGRRSKIRKHFCYTHSSLIHPKLYPAIYFSLIFTFRNPNGKRTLNTGTSNSKSKVKQEKNFETSMKVHQRSRFSSFFVSCSISISVEKSPHAVLSHLQDTYIQMTVSFSLDLGFQV